MDFLLKLPSFIAPYPGWVKWALGVWVAFGALLFLVFILHRPHPASLPENANRVPSSGSVAATSTSSDGAPAFVTEPAISTLSAEEVVEKVNSAPPLQKKEVAQSFVGIYVDWTGYLQDAEDDFSDKNRKRVTLVTDKSRIVTYSIRFSINLQQLPELKILHRYSKLRVKGSIVSVSGADVEVRPTEVQILERSST